MMDPKICKTLAQSINALCLSEERADVHFKLPISMADPKVTKRIPAHTLILSGASPPFDAMFSGNWREAANGEDIVVPDIAAGIFERLLAYVYKDEVDLSVMDTELVIALYYAAKKYEVSGLVTFCMDYFLCGTTRYAMKVKDAFSLLEYCLGKDEPELRARAIQLIQRFTEEALDSKAFLDASRAVVEVVFSLDELSVSEICLFKAAYKWTKHQCAGSEDPDEIRREMASILELIRFPTMDHREFCQEVAPTRLLTEKEAFPVLLQIGDGSDGEPPAKKSVSRFSRISRKVVDGGTLLALKIAHFPDWVAAGYLEKKAVWSSDKIQVCGPLWRLTAVFLAADFSLARNGHPPKYVPFYLDCLPPTDGTAGSGEEDNCVYHVDACFRIDKTHGNTNTEEVEVECGYWVQSSTHIYSNQKFSKWGVSFVGAYEELLDPKNGYLSADDDQSLEVVVKFFVTKMAPQKKE